MAEGVNIIDEIFADSDSDEETFEGFDLEDVGNGVNQRNSSNYDVLNDDQWIAGDRDPEQLQFTGQAGVQKEISNPDSPLSYFELFVNDDDYENIASETNVYAEQYLRDKQLNEKSRFQKWRETTATEMKKFIALIIAMGLLSQLDISEYWTVNPVTATPFFPSVMSRDRFYLLLTFFHLNDNDRYVPRGNEGHDPLFKLGPLYHRILWQFRSVYYPHQSVAIDEAMVAWHGKLSFRVYSPDKPVKYGLKAYVLCDADNAYCLKFKLYTGKQSVAPSENGATYDLVMDLMRNHFDKGHVLYCDNYYTSPRLFMDLWMLGTGATGTVRQCRKGIPTAIKQINLQNKGDTTTMHYGPLSCLKYKDSKVVYLISTTETSTNIQSGRHDHQTNEPKVRPSMVVAYDGKMGAVDRNNQMVASYKLNIKTLKWWKKLIFHLINLAVVNAYVVYKESVNAPQVQRLFRRRLVSQLIESVTEPNNVQVGRPAPRILERLIGRHFPNKLDDGGKTASKQCVVCGPAERSMLGPLQPGQKRPKRCGHLTSFICKQ